MKKDRAASLSHSDNQIGRSQQLRSEIKILNRQIKTSQPTGNKSIDALISTLKEHLSKG